jgi:hypothetical protein
MDPRWSDWMGWWRHRSWLRMGNGRHRLRHCRRSGWSSPIIIWCILNVRYASHRWLWERCRCAKDRWIESGRVIKVILCPDHIPGDVETLL